MIWNVILRMRRWREVIDFASQKFRWTPVVTSGVSRAGVPKLGYMYP